MMYKELVIGLLIPFLGTALGAGMVFLMKNQINRKLEKFLLGFASRCNACCFCLESNDAFYYDGRISK